MNAEEIVRKYSDMIYGVAMRYVRNRADADDVYSDVFYRYFMRERVFESEEHRKYWLLRVSVNCSKKYVSRRRNDEELNDDMFGNVPLSGTDTPLEDLMDLRAALAELSEEAREVIELYYLNGLNSREISLMLQCSENTIRARLRRGKEKLRQFLTE